MKVKTKPTNHYSLKTVHWPIGLYKVHGGSMLPAIYPGALLLGWRWFKSPKVGQTVVVNVGGKDMVKFITEVSGNQYWLEGTNKSASTDSRHFGMVKRPQIEAIIFFQIGKPT